MDTEFAEIKTSMADFATTLADIKTALAAPPPPAPPASGGSEVHPGLRPTPNGVPMSFSEAVSTSGQQPVVNDVTTPNFNRRANPTKLFCNLHDRAKVAKRSLLLRFQFWLMRQVLKMTISLFWAIL